MGEKCDLIKSGEIQSKPFDLVTVFVCTWLRQTKPIPVLCFLSLVYRCYL